MHYYALDDDAAGADRRLRRQSGSDDRRGRRRGDQEASPPPSSPGAAARPTSPSTAATTRKPTCPSSASWASSRAPAITTCPCSPSKTPSGKLRAVAFGYACHATVLVGYEWSGDYPGFAQIALEKAHPGAIALFWAGCGGDQNPLPRRRPSSWPRHTASSSPPRSMPCSPSR